MLRTEVDDVVARQQRTFPAATGQVSFSELGRELIGQDIDNLQAALGSHGISQGFLNTLSPGSGSRIADDHYESVDAFLDAWVDVMAPEYRAIADAGLVLQVDDPSIAENFDQITPEPSIEDYLEFTRKRVDAVNRALAGIDRSQVRFHLCWGSWHGTHTTDLALAVEAVDGSAVAGVQWHPGLVESAGDEVDGVIARSVAVAREQRHHAAASDRPQAGGVQDRTAHGLV